MISKPKEIKKRSIHQNESIFPKTWFASEHISDDWEKAEAFRI